MTIVLMTAGAILLVFFMVVMFLKFKNNLSWSSAFKEAFEYMWNIF